MQCQTTVNQKQIIKHKQSKFKYFIKGSGTSHCLLNGSIEDEKQFILFKFYQHLEEKDKQQFKRIKQISLSGLYLLILLQNGNLYRLGMFLNHQNVVKIPKIICLPIKIIQISSGWDHSILKTQNNQFYGLGSNKFFEISLNQKKYYFQPQKITQIVSEYKIQKFVCGFRQSYFIDQNGNLYGCGQSKKYELGFKNIKSTSFIFIQKHQRKVKKLKCSKKALFLLDQQNDLYCLGQNEYQIFNHSSKKVEDFCMKLTKINSNIKQFSCGWSSIIILKQKYLKQNQKQSQELKYELQSYGRNNFGQLGRFNNVNSKKVQFKQEIKTLDQFYLQSGTQFSFCINQYQLYGWGWNQHQNIINRNDQLIKSPQKVNLPFKIQESHKLKCKRVWTYPAITIVQMEKY